MIRVTGDDTAPFGGLNMIFAGDFAQLPPMIGKEVPLCTARLSENNLLNDMSKNRPLEKLYGIKLPLL
jgi:hypothetical protein